MIIKTFILFVFCSAIYFFSAKRLIRNQYYSNLTIYVYVVHIFLSIAYYLYALSNPSDSLAYYRKVLRHYRGDYWGDFYGTSTTFIEFVGYPFIHYLDFHYEDMMVLFSFLGLLGFLFMMKVVEERIKFPHKILFFYFRISTFGQRLMVREHLFFLR